MAIDTTIQRSRRAILIGALGGVVASAVATLGRASPVGATDGQAVLVGGTYSATTLTEIDGNGAAAFVGTSDNNFGFLGQSGSGKAIEGDSGTNIGIIGTSGATDKEAILGWSIGDSTGVEGYSGGAPFPNAPNKTGVYGYANQDANAVGVKGQSVLGTGGLFTAGANGTSLRATGRVRFDKAVGVATVAAATNSITVTPGTDLTSTSAVVATLQGIPSGSALVKSVAVNPTANTFTIYLTANATHATKVAWHVFG